MEDFSPEDLHRFIIKAKAATYAGNGRKLLPYRLCSKDLQYAEEEFVYHDSYFGESDFFGQEVVYHAGQAVWGMNYFGRLLRPDLLTAAEAGRMIKESLSHLYREGRFLGSFEYIADDLRYTDTNEGTLDWFTGREQIDRRGLLAYELHYHGGFCH
ncbi:MAG: DUF5680 domain-containing protein [Mycobacterium leprae]